MRSFEMSIEDSFGDVQVVELKPNGSQIPVTESNRNEFVTLAVDVNSPQKKLTLKFLPLSLNSPPNIQFCFPSQICTVAAFDHCFRLQ